MNHALDRSNASGRLKWKPQWRCSVNAAVRRLNSHQLIWSFTNNFYDHLDVFCYEINSHLNPRSVVMIKLAAILLAPAIIWFVKWCIFDDRCSVATRDGLNHFAAARDALAIGDWQTTKLGPRVVSKNGHREG